jgi:hypothetical protein
LEGFSGHFFLQASLAFFRQIVCQVGSAGKFGVLMVVSAPALNHALKHLF